MKLFILCLMLISILPACDKSTDKDAASQIDLIGKWRYTEQFTSNGEPGVWLPAQPEGQVITFEADGDFNASGILLQGPTKFDVLDSVRIRLTPATTDGGVVVMGYKIDTVLNELELYPLEPGRCIEGCNSKFQRVID